MTILKYRSKFIGLLLTLGMMLMMFPGIATASFTAATDSTTANGVTALGLTGTTATTSDATIATADLTTVSGYVTITSVSAGTATITVSDGTNNATIPVTVAADGTITIGTITPYTVPAVTFTAATDSTTANDVATLGLTGSTATTSDATVATADLTTISGYVTITSVGAGTATITVSDGTNDATIDVTIATDGEITVGTITPYAASFTAITDSTTANDVATLGLTGTSATTSDATVATADLTTVSGYVTITSVSAGTATITVSDGTNTATIPVKVATDGEITVGTITPFTSSSPTVQTEAASTITADSSVLNGDITSDNGYDITDYGFLWGTNSDSLTNNLDVGTDNHSGTFTANLSNLSAGTVYYFQAYATNAGGTTDGTVISFTTTTSAAPITTNVPVLSDVSASYWGYNAISDLSSKGIVSGYPDGTFKPDASITRAEFATMLVKALGLNTTETTSKFTDVTADVWYNGIVNAAVSANLVSGMDDNLFAPNTLITREQMAVMAAKALGEKAPVIDGTELSAFGDKSTVSSWAVSGTSEAVKAGIINGMTTDTLAPVTNATRAQAAEMVNKLLTILGN